MQNNRIIWIFSILSLGVLITIIYLFFTRFTPAPSDDTSTKLSYITGNKLIYVNCEKSPCSFTVRRNSDGDSNTKYESISVLNPATQTFQAKFYVTDSWTWGYGGGIAYVGDSDYATVSVIPVYQVGTRDFYVQNITEKELGELRSWWWYSSFYDTLIIFGIPVGFLIIMSIALAFLNGLMGIAEEGIEFLGTKDGKKLLKKVDKNIRKRY